MLFAAAAMAFTACNKENDIEDVVKNDETTTIRFSAAVTVRAPARCSAFMSAAIRLHSVAVEAVTGTETPPRRSWMKYEPLFSFRGSGIFTCNTSYYVRE